MSITSVHLIVSLVLLGLWRKFSKADIPLWTVLLGGFLAIILDADYAIDFVLRDVDIRATFHRVWTHSLIWPILLAAAAITVRLMKKKEYRILKWTLPKTHLHYALLFSSVALFLHLALDCALSGPFFLSWIPPGVYEGAFPFCVAWLTPKHDIILGSAVVVPWFIWMIYKKNFKDVV